MNTAELIQDIRRITRLNTRDLSDQRIIDELNLSYFLILEEIKQINSSSKISGDDGELWEDIEITDTSILKYEKTDKNNNIVKIKFKPSYSDDFVCLKHGSRCETSTCEEYYLDNIQWEDNEEFLIFNGELELGTMRVYYRSGLINQKFDSLNLDWINKLPHFSHPVLSADASMKILPDKKSNLYYIAEAQYQKYKEPLIRHFSSKRKTIKKIKFNFKKNKR